VATGGVCQGSGCDTEKFVAAVNAEALCGFTDWRLPKREELRSIIDYESRNLESSHFPNGRGDSVSAVDYWSATPYTTTSASKPTISNQGDGAWKMFTTGFGSPENKNTPLAVRLVR